MDEMYGSLQVRQCYKMLYLAFTIWPVRISKLVVCINVVALLHANFTYNVLATKAHRYKLHTYIV